MVTLLSTANPGWVLERDSGRPVSPTCHSWKERSSEESSTSLNSLLSPPNTWQNSIKMICGMSEWILIPGPVQLWKCCLCWPSSSRPGFRKAKKTAWSKAFFHLCITAARFTTKSKPREASYQASIRLLLIMQHYKRISPPPHSIINASSHPSSLRCHPSGLCSHWHLSDNQIKKKNMHTPYKEMLQNSTERYCPNNPSKMRNIRLSILCTRTFWWAHQALS